MRIHVVDDLVGLVGVAGGRTAVVELVARHNRAGCRLELVVAQVSDEADAHEIGLRAQIGDGPLGRPVDGVAVGVGAKAGAEALREGRRAVDGASAVHGVAQAVVERRDAGAAELALRGLLEARIVRHLAEVPALAVEEDVFTVDAVLLQRQLVEGRPHREHVVLRVVAHEVEAEPVDAVVARPGDDGVDHELLGELVLGRDVLAAGRGLDIAHRVQAVVVAGNDAVEHRLLPLAGLGGVVEHLVEHDLEAGRVQRADHLAELSDACPTVGVHRVRALGGREVIRVVPPVETVEVADRADARLLLVRRRPERLKVARGLGLLRTHLFDRGDVEGGQQMHGRDAGLGKLTQLLRARRVPREGAVRAALVSRNRLIPD